MATTDPEIIRQWWSEDRVTIGFTKDGREVVSNPSFNVGVATGGGLLVIDIDVKKGKQGLATAIALDLDFTSTRVVRTPSGGFHLYYRGPDVLNQVERLGSGLDVRSAGGYVVGAGSIIDDQEYSDEGATDIREVPPSIIHRLTAPPERRGDQAPAIEPDRPDAIDRGVEYLTGPAPLAIEGAGGDGTTFRVAAHLKDFGISEATAAELMAAHWNERCSPPWPVEELQTKVANAYEYGARPLGDLSPAADFAGVKIEPPTSTSSMSVAPKALPPDLPAVAPFEDALWPPAFRDCGRDLSERLQCPPDFIAVTLVIALGAVLGRKIGIRPQQRTPYVEVPNLWGMVVGRPGVLKSPAVKAALAPAKRLDSAAARQFAAEQSAHSLVEHRFKLEQQAREKRWKEAAGKGEAPDPLDIGTRPAEPKQRRYIVHDSSYEALGIILSENPNGVLVFRDELVSLLKPLDREENASARGFYLAGWNGNGDYSFDRITRGSIYIEACCVSLLGATQPARLAEYLRHAVRGGSGDDGFAQRFGLLVYPDISPIWTDIDRAPDASAATAVNQLFERLDRADAISLGAQVDQLDPVPFLRFDDHAQGAYRAWRTDLERRKRSGELHPALEAHLAKYHGLAAKLALIFHLIEERRGPVSAQALTLALRWMAYLETHAMRAYASVTATPVINAKLILRKIQAGRLDRVFTLRDIQQAGWAGLNDSDDIRTALDLLVDYRWLDEQRVQTGGRPKDVFTLSPQAAVQ